MDKLLLAGELSPTILAFSLQYAPKAFHRSVVDAVSYPGHALPHVCLFQLVKPCSCTGSPCRCEITGQLPDSAVTLCQMS